MKNRTILLGLSLAAKGPAKPALPNGDMITAGSNRYVATLPDGEDGWMDFSFWRHHAERLHRHDRIDLHIGDLIVELVVVAADHVVKLVQVHELRRYSLPVTMIQRREGDQSAGVRFHQ
jgi:hypothetical protein